MPKYKADPSPGGRKWIEAAAYVAGDGEIAVGDVLPERHRRTAFRLPARSSVRRRPVSSR
jgi:hypothetical protein